MKRTFAFLIALSFFGFQAAQAQYTNGGGYGEEYVDLGSTDGDSYQQDGTIKPTIGANESSDGLLTIWYENLVGQTATVSLIDRQGRTVKTARVSNQDTKGWLRMGVASLAAGLYIVQIESGRSKAVTKTILR